MSPCTPKVICSADIAAFNAIYERYFHEPYPARTTTISDLAIGMLEVDAVLYMAGNGKRSDT